MTGTLGTASPPTMRPIAIRAGLTGAILVLVVVLVTGFGLQQFKTQATRAAFERVELEGEAAEQGFRRQLDGVERLGEHLNRYVRVADSDPLEAGFAILRMRRILADSRYAMVALAFLGNDPAQDWQLDAGPELLDADLLAAARRGGVAKGALMFGQPRQRSDGRWLVPVLFRVAVLGNSEDAGIGVLMMDCARLSGVLAGLQARPDRIVALWRESGEIVAGSIARPGEGLERRITLPPEATGGTRRTMMMPSPLLGYERFFALHPIAGTNLLLSVSSSREGEMAGFNRFSTASIIAACIAIVLILCGSALLVLVVLRRQTRRALEVAEERLAAGRQMQAELERIMEGLPAGIVLMTATPTGIAAARHYNTGSARLLRITPEALAEAGAVMNFADPPVSSDLMPNMLAGLRDQGEYQYEASMRCGDGKLRWMRFHAQVIAREGETMQCIGMMTDISVERAAAEAAVLSARLATLGELSAGIAHEVKQPLTAISLVAANMQFGVQKAPPLTSDQIVAALGRIIAMTERATEIMDHLRAIARRQEEGLNTVSLREAVAGALLMVRAMARDSGLDVTVDIPDALPPVVGHAILLEQVLINLVINARDAIAASEAETGTVRISAVMEDGMAVLRVRDSGTGIPAEVMPHLFEAFFTTKPAGHGTGLGLSISASILKACGGSISAANPPGGGAEFTIRLLPENHNIVQLASAA